MADVTPSTIAVATERTFQTIEYGPPQLNAKKNNVAIIPFRFCTVVLLGIVFSFNGDCFADEANAEVAKASKVVPVWSGKMPAWKAPTEPEQDKTKTTDKLVAGRRLVRLGNVATPELHLFPATGKDASDTFVVVCPGGGYTILAWDLEGTEIATWLQSIGVSAAVLKYRVPTRESDQKWVPPVQDIQRSISLLDSGTLTARKPVRIGVLGFSAGGNASARTITSIKRHYEPTDEVDSYRFLPDFGVLVYPAWTVEADNQSKLIDDIKVTETTPPIFFAHAGNDRISCMNSVTLFAELQKHNIPASLHIFAKGGHGFGARKNGLAVDHWPDLCAAWMRDQGWLAK